MRDFRCHDADLVTPLHCSVIVGPAWTTDHRVTVDLRGFTVVDHVRLITLAEACLLRDCWPMIDEFRSIASHLLATASTSSMSIASDVDALAARRLARRLSRRVRFAVRSDDACHSLDEHHADDPSWTSVVIVAIVVLSSPPDRARAAWYDQPAAHAAWLRHGSVIPAFSHWPALCTRLFHAGLTSVTSGGPPCL